jgi:transposase
MRKLEISDVSVMRVALQQEILRSQESRYDHRLHGLLLISQGLDCYQVAEWLGQNPTTVQRWVHRFERHGFAGLEEGERSGRPPRLTETQLGQADRDLRRSPRQFGYAQNLWDGKLLAHHLRQTCGVRLGSRQCQRIFHLLRFRLRKPRPVMAQADPAAQARYKKTPPPGPRSSR